MIITLQVYTNYLNVSYRQNINEISINQFFELISYVNSSSLISLVCKFKLRKLNINFTMSWFILIVIVSYAMGPLQTLSPKKKKKNQKPQ